MDSSQERNGERMLMPMCARVINSDISEDFTLPDYYPEIRRVLYVREEALPPSGFMGGNKIDVNGVMDYTLIYVSGEGRICSAPISAEYAFSVPVEGSSDFELGDGVTMMIHTVCDNSSIRVSGPRRLSVRSRLRTSVNAWGRMVCGENFCSPEDLSSVETLMGESECAEIICESSDIITLNTEYVLSSPDQYIAMANGRVSVGDSRVDGEIAEIGGEVVVCFTVIENGRAEKIEKRIPFEAQVELDGGIAADEGTVRVMGAVTDLSLNVEEGKVDIAADITLEVCYASNRAVRYVRDAYSTDKSGEAITRTYTVPLLFANGNITAPLSARVSAENIAAQKQAEIADIWGKAIVGGVEDSENGYRVTGKCKYDMVWISDGEYSHSEAEVPFECDIDIDVMPTCFDSIAEVRCDKIRRDGDSVVIDSILELSFTALGGSETEMLEEIRFTGKADVEKDKWTVVYVSPDCSLWDIAKRYGVREGDIKGDPATDRYVIIER